MLYNASRTKRSGSFIFMKKKILKKLSGLIYPVRCPGCDGLLLGREKRPGFCVDCLEEVTYVREPYCKKCGKQLKDDRQYLCRDCENKRHYFTEARSVYVYRGCLMRAVYRFKYSNRRCYADAFARDAVRLCGDWIRACGISAVIPVPMYAKKKRKRGYNQAEVLADRLAEGLGIPCDKRAVERTRSTRPQKDLGIIERQINLKNAFKCRGNVVQSLYEQKCVLVIDDIYTTGATVDEIARVLLEAGVARVYVLTLCSGTGI